MNGPGRGPRVPRDVLVAALAGVAVFLLAGAAELAAVRVLGVDARELDGVSDVILSAAFAAAVFLRMRLQASRSEMSRLEREHLILETQLAVAADIQRRMLPAAPARAAGCRWAARLRPAGRVGGDFYDFIESGPDSLLVVVADISGKGIPAALLLASTRTLFRNLARQTRDPGAILTALSAATHAEYEGLPYVTALVARVDGREHRLAYANAGHPAGLVLGDRGVATLESLGPPLGLFAETAYAAVELALPPASVGVLVTDGITEALEAGGPAADALAAIAADRAAASTPQRLCDAIMRLAEERAAAGTVAVPDDRTVVAWMVDDGDHAER